MSEINSIIVRCLNHNRCDSTLNGELYMNSLHHFLKNCNMSQSDYFEGAAYRLPISEMPFSEDFKKSLEGEYIYGLPVGFKYLHVYCFSRLETKVDGSFLSFKCPSDEQFREFGDRCLVIKDPEELFRRILNECNKLRYKVFIGKVTYMNVPSRGNVLLKTENSGDLFADKTMNVTPFIKGKDHETEMEFRILVLPDSNIAGPIKLHIGSIKDIAYVSHIKTNNGLSIKNSAKKYNIKMIRSDYVLSNCDLSEMCLEAFHRGNRETMGFFRFLPKE